MEDSDASYRLELENRGSVGIFFEADTAMNIKLSLGIVLLWASVAGADAPARLVFSSVTDFTDVSLQLKKAGGPDPANVEVTVALSPDASARARSTTLLAYQKYVRLQVDGYQISTSRVHSVLGAELRFLAPRALAIEWMTRFSGDTLASQPTM